MERPAFTVKELREVLTEGQKKVLWLLFELTTKPRVSLPNGKTVHLSPLYDGIAHDLPNTALCHLSGVSTDSLVDMSKWGLIALGDAGKATYHAGVWELSTREKFVSHPIVHPKSPWVFGLEGGQEFVSSQFASEQSVSLTPWGKIIASQMKSNAISEVPKVKGRKNKNESDPADAARIRNQIRDGLDCLAEEGEDPLSGSAYSIARKAMKFIQSENGSRSLDESQLKKDATWIADQVKSDGTTLRKYLDKWSENDQKYQ